MHVYGWNWLKDSSVHAKLTYHNSFIGVSKTSVTLSYHSVASQCTVTISSSNITLTTLGMLMVVPKSFHKSVATASSHAILKTSHQGSWHRGVDRHGMRSCHPMPWLRGEMSEFDRLWSVLAVLGWRLARNVAYISAVCCLSSICLSCDRLQYCIVLSLKFLCKTFVLLLHLSWRTVSSLNWQISSDKLTLFNSQNMLQHRHASALEFAPIASECIAALAETTFYCKGQSIAKGYQCLWGDGQGAGQVSIHISIWKSIKNCFSNSLCTAIVHTLFLEAGWFLTPWNSLLSVFSPAGNTIIRFWESRAGGGVGWNNFCWTWNHVWYYDTLCTHARR